mgnify:CR=1 FL=1
MASTVNGYEGTGRSLSLKLIQQLRAKAANGPVGAGNGGDEAMRGALVGRTLREVSLEEPIRYAAGDPVEKWLNSLLCLDATANVPPIRATPHPVSAPSAALVHIEHAGGPPRLGDATASQSCPPYSPPAHQSECDLYWVDRDALFSYHSASEAFLQRVLAICVSSHYKNTPNDLQVLAPSLPSLRLGPIGALQAGAFVAPPTGPQAIVYASPRPVAALRRPRAPALCATGPG